MIRTVVVDDEPLAREGVRLLLGRDPEVAVVGEAESGRAAIDEIRRLRPDLLLLDVQLPDMDGFEVLGALGSHEPRAVVFITAYDRFALRAFEVHALDYLLKPFSDERFADALRRAKERLAVAPAPARLVLKDGGRVVFLPVAEIDWVEAADDYVELHAGKQSFLHRESLASLAARLEGAGFVRAHRRALVNRERLREVRERGRAYVAILEGGTEVPVARSQRHALIAPVRRSREPIR